tara:strand:+ start:921 stop:1160 length:240 start_codon:yes stop_codon:yes gene_type:complete
MKWFRKIINRISEDITKEIGFKSSMSLNATFLQRLEEIHIAQKAELKVIQERIMGLVESEEAQLLMIQNAQRSIKNETK